MKTYVIAEAGVNHNGKLDQAKALVIAAADAGASAVKFQTFKADELSLTSAPKASYQKRTTGSDGSQQDMLRQLELSEEDHFVLRELCKQRQIDFLSSPFDLASLQFLTTQLDLKLIKLGSGEITNGPLLLAAARSQRPIILSTGMSTLHEVEQALAVIAFGLHRQQDPQSSTQILDFWHQAQGATCLDNNVTLLHCVTDYPAAYSDVNLKAMDSLQALFGLPVGYSDHTPGIQVSVAAVARGATVIEKHLTLDRTLPGPDQAASLEAQEFKELVHAINAIEDALSGSGQKQPADAELDNRNVARKSLVTLAPIAADEPFSAHNLGCKRPGTGISPMEYWDYLGKTARMDFPADSLVKS